MHHYCTPTKLKSLAARAWRSLMAFAVNLFTGGAPQDADIEERRLLVGISTLCSAAILFLLLFFLKRFLQKSYEIAVADISVAVLLAVFMVFVRRRKRLKQIAILIVALMGGFFAFLYANGSVEATGALWSYGFPFLALLLLGRGWGMTFSLTLLSVNLLLPSCRIAPAQPPYTPEFV
jgi:hypothetical protein